MKSSVLKFAQLAKTRVSALGSALVSAVLSVTALVVTTSTLLVACGGGDDTVAPPQQEVLDFRPAVGCSRTAYKEMKIVATINAASKKRVIGFDHRDFNLVFVPLRHMVFQGDALNPKGPQSSLTYASEAALLKKFQSTVQQMYSPTGAVTLAESLKAFVNEKYHYMNGAGVTGYAGYILGSGAGEAKGLKPDMNSIDLYLDGRKAIGVSQ